MALMRGGYMRVVHIPFVSFDLWLLIGSSRIEILSFTAELWISG
jgi:hypothetical protein